MSKFLKVIVNIFLICAIAVAAAILVPPLAGVNTTIVDSQSMETNLPVGSVTYSKDTYITNLETGDNILDQTSTSTYKYTIVSADTATGNFEVRNAYDSSAETKTIQILNSTPKVFITVPFIGYVVYAMHSIEGIIIVALVILLMVILFILSELWKKESEEEFMEEYYAAEEEKAAAKKAEEYEDEDYEDSDTEYDDESDDEYEDGDEEDDEYEDEYSDEYDEEHEDYQTLGGDTEEFTPPFTIVKAEEDSDYSDSWKIDQEDEASEDDAGMQMNAALGMAAVAAGGFFEEDATESEDTGDEEEAKETGEPEDETDEISSNLEAVLEKYTREEGDAADTESESSSIEEKAAEDEEEVLIADDEASSENVETAIEAGIDAKAAEEADIEAETEAVTEPIKEPETKLNAGESLNSDENPATEFEAFNEEDLEAETDPEDPDRFVPVKRLSYEEILAKAEAEGLDPEVEKDQVSGVQIVDFSELL